MRAWGSYTCDQTNPPRGFIPAGRLHAELTAFLSQHGGVAGQRHLVLLGWMVAGLLLDQWKRSIPLGRCLASSWQRRCWRWLSNGRIDVPSVYGPQVLWAIQGWQNRDQTLHLVLDTTMLWNRICMVVASLVCPALSLQRH